LIAYPRYAGALRGTGEVNGAQTRDQRAKGEEVKRILGVLFVAWAVLSASATAAGVLWVDNASHDFGEVLSGQVLTRAFLLSNSGDAVLNITNVRTACGCTVASWQTADLAPGASISLEATFSTAGYHGRVMKTVTVYYRDQSNGPTRTLALTLSATVLTPEPYDLPAGELEYAFLLLVDLRSSDLYAVHHLLGALSIPYDELADWIGLLPRGVFTILYDQDGTVGPAAARTLNGAGYPEVQYLQGGINAWTQRYTSRFAASGPAAGERFLLAAESPSWASSGVLAPVDVSYLNREFLVLIDLRTPESYAAAHFAGAVNVQPADLPAWAARLPNTTHIVLYDEDGSVARTQAIALYNAGFTKAQALFGGLAEWRATFGDRFLAAAQ
jgi:rhodanese-related sulfurtransferase